MKKRTDKSKTTGIILCTIGSLMIIFSIGLFLRNSEIEKRAQLFSNEALVSIDPILYDRKKEISEKNKNGNVFVPDYILAPDMSMSVEIIDGKEYIGTLDIPALDLHLPVQSELDDVKMKASPCRMEGTVYNRDIIIGAHSFRFHFGYLKNLEQGDLVTFTDMAGNQFKYNVIYTEILAPTQLPDLQSGEWDMTLFTCTVGGRARVVVRLELI